MRSFVAILLIIFATGVGLLTYIAAGGRVTDLVGDEVASMLPFDLDFLAKDDRRTNGLPVPEVTSDVTLGQPSISSEPNLGSSSEDSHDDAMRPGDSVLAQEETSSTAPSIGATGQADSSASDSSTPEANQVAEAGAGGSKGSSLTVAPSGSGPEAGLPEGPFKLSLPLDCEYGKNCFIQYYADSDPGPGFSDYACGPLAFNGHKGVDFRVPSYRDMERGVAVIAAAPGKVIKIRDGLPDAHYGLFGKEGVRGLERGNTIVIQHQDDYKTIYSHLKRGSALVTEGQFVARGEPIAALGMSGLTITPAVQLEVLKGRQTIDPFSGRTVATECGLGTAANLWLPVVAAELSYSRTLILRIGFSRRELTRAAAEYDLFDYEAVSPRAKQLWFSAYMAGVHDGDSYSILVTGPDGEVFHTAIGQFDAPAATKLIKAGRKTEEGPLNPGTYTAHFKYFKAPISEDAEPETVFDIKRQVNVGNR